MEKQIKEENIYIKKIQGQTGGDDDDEVIFSLQIINMTTGLGPVTPVFNDSPKTVTIGTTIITTQNRINRLCYKSVYSKFNWWSNELKFGLKEGDKYVVPTQFQYDNWCFTGDNLIGEFVTNPKSKSFIQPIKTKKKWS